MHCLASSTLWKATNANPLLSPVTRSLLRNVLRIGPNGRKSICKSASVVFAETLLTRTVALSSLSYESVVSPGLRFFRAGGTYFPGAPGAGESVEANTVCLSAPALTAICCAQFRVPSFRSCIFILKASNAFIFLSSIALASSLASSSSPSSCLIHSIMIGSIEIVEIPRSSPEPAFSASPNFFHPLRSITPLLTRDVRLLTFTFFTVFTAYPSAFHPHSSIVFTPFSSTVSCLGGSPYSSSSSSAQSPPFSSKSALMMQENSQRLNTIAIAVENSKAVSTSTTPDPTTTTTLTNPKP
mmetsp:Transcript_11237/g.22592  ORF Transcript_11237/g.22592 Transcript_11237/m.22592 type:complete len:298 (+) Transcript_11237:468-1361(+)